MLWPKSPRPDGQTTGRLLQEALEQARPHLAEGQPADYIPELAGADPTRLGAALMANGRLYRA
ncbi:MAG: hypothetical protein IJ484_09135, partial [Oscillospiraceae bacterium]|nr:hypothetical protein [Oscillospiraceae bacterium]